MRIIDLSNDSRFDQYGKKGRPKKKRSKYKNKKVVVDGHLFPSEHEARRYCELKLLVRAKVIADLRIQVKYQLIPPKRDEKGKLLERATDYIADFVYTDLRTGQEVVEDAKGCRTKDYIIKRKLMLQVHGIRIKEV